MLCSTPGTSSTQFSSEEEESCAILKCRVLGNSIEPLTHHLGTSLSRRSTSHEAATSARHWLQSRAQNSLNPGPCCSKVVCTASSTQLSTCCYPPLPNPALDQLGHNSPAWLQLLQDQARCGTHDAACTVAYRGTIGAPLLLRLCTLRVQLLPPTRMTSTGSIFSFLFWNKPGRADAGVLPCDNVEAEKPEKQLKKPPAVAWQLPAQERAGKLPRPMPGLE